MSEFTSESSDFALENVDEEESNVELGSVIEHEFSGVEDEGFGDEEDEFDDDEDDLDLDESSVDGDLKEVTVETDTIFVDQAPTVVMTSLPVTGEPRVDDAIARLNDLATLPVDEHVAVFEDVQRRLHDTLADLSGQ